MADHVAVGRNSESNAVDDAFVANAGTGHHIHVSEHSRLDVAQLGFTEVGDDPPDAGVDEGEDMLARGCVGSLGKGQVGDPGIEWGEDTAVVEVVFCRVDGGLLAESLSFERFESGDVVRCLLDLLVALLEQGLRLLVLCLGGQEAGLGQFQLRFRLVSGLRTRDLQGARLVYLVDGDKLTRQQWLNPVQVIRGIHELRIGAVDGVPGAANISLCLFDGGGSAGNAGLGAQHTRLGHIDAARFGGDDAALVADLAFERLLVRAGMGESIGIRAFIDIEEWIAGLHLLIVGDIQMGHGSVDEWGHADVIREDFGIISARIGIDLMNDEQRDHARADHHPDADGAAHDVKAIVRCVRGHYSSSIQ